MTFDRKQELVQELITDVIISETWNKEQSDNPEIITAEGRFYGIVDALRKYAPEGLIDALTDATHEYVGAYERGAMLHGINVADALREVAARPSNLAELISARLKANRVSAEAQQ